MRNERFKRVSRRRVCPICGRPDWCLFTGPDDAPTAAICARIESAKRSGEAGWFHSLRDDGSACRERRLTVRVAMPQPEPNKPAFAELAGSYRRAVEPVALERLADSLGVSAESLRRLDIGWSPDRRAWTFPMTAPLRDVAYRCETVGIRLRLPGGRKLSVKGGKEGLFIPDNLDWAGGPILCCEGPTDTAAMLDLGFDAVGRPSCTGGAALLTRFACNVRFGGFVIVADADEPGQRGAEILAAKLAVHWDTVWIITPPSPFKDARAWKCGGATRADVLDAIDAAPVRTLRVSTRLQRKGARHG